MTDQQLLRDYADSHNEAAFAELVKRHIDFVYSTALRMLNDRHLAQDVAQGVFVALAQDSRRLSKHPVINGWLHCTARNLASNTVRTNVRRHARELDPATMNALMPTESEPPWEKVSPHLDSALAQLNDSDRNALLLRYFQGKSAREIGQVLQTSEAAAQKRINRAVEKLRNYFAKHGASASIAGLIALISSNAVQAVPVGVYDTVLKTALSTLPAASLTGVGLTWTWVKTGSCALLFGLVLLLTLHFTLPSIRTVASSPDHREAEPAAVAKIEEPSSPLQQLASTNLESGPSTPAGKPLHLRVLSQEDGKPLSDVQINFLGWTNSLRASMTNTFLTAAPDGTCDILIPLEINKSQFSIVKEGFADTRLQWDVDRNEVMPTNYILKMIRPALLAGRVLDENGNPVKGARVAVNPGSNALPGNPPENHSFIPFGLSTDSEGRWSANRIAQEVLPYISITATHPSYAGAKGNGSLSAATADNPRPETNVLFVLKSGVRVTGIVSDDQGRAIQGARIEVGLTGMSNSRKTISGIDGRFSLDACSVGKNTILANAQDYLPRSIDFTNTADSRDVIIKLEHGAAEMSSLRIRVIDTQGNPISNAAVAVSQPGFHDLPISKYTFRARTDSNGEIVRTNVPASDIALSASAKGFMNVYGFVVRPDGREHFITMPPGLTVQGTVIDADTGLPIPRFKITTGEPTRFRRSNPSYRSKEGVLITTNMVVPFEGGVTNIAWSPLESLTLSFEQGKFSHTYEERVVPTIFSREPVHPGYILKFEAEGYSPFYSRILNADEERVTVDAMLKPARKVSITILTPEGMPAAFADVGFVWPGSRLRLKPSGLVRNGTSPENTVVPTDERGRFTWLPDPAVQRIIIVHWKGILQINPSDLHADINLQLEPWSRLEGTIARTPSIAQYNLVPEFENIAWSGLSFDMNGFATKPDSTGHFVMPQIPPGSLDLFWCLSNSDPSSFRKETDDLMVQAGFERHIQKLTNVVVKAGTTNVIHLIAPAPLPSNRINPIK